ncbi:MAG: low molecular weight phosphotyrosine protein phosphatase [Actinomycetota bacterium]|nr:low molecular weight phosphotyrosine protein phosphatase [Actinomycetota bacterium]
MQLPPAHDPDRPYTIALVCLGNICRSPIADVVLGLRLAEHGLDDRYAVVSSGTGSWHVGDGMDAAARTELEAHGYDATRHRARQFEAQSFGTCDLVLAMDARNRHDVLALARTDEDRSRVAMFRSFDPQAGPGDDEVPDPWGGGPEGFTQVRVMVERTVDALVEQLARR